MERFAAWRDQGMSMEAGFGILIQPTAPARCIGFQRSSPEL